MQLVIMALVHRLADRQPMTSYFAADVCVEGGRHKVTPLVSVTHHSSHLPSSCTESVLAVVLAVCCAEL